jgi:hypothetical protein
LVAANATGSWLLAPRMIGSYHATIDAWLENHKRRTIGFAAPPARAMSRSEKERATSVNLSRIKATNARGV